MFRKLRSHGLSRTVGSVCWDRITHPTTCPDTSSPLLPEPYLIVLAANEGADRTACARWLREWATFGLVLDAEEPRAVYERIAALVPKHGKVLLVETVPAAAASWLSFLSALPGGEFVP